MGEVQNFILAPKAREEERHAAQRHHANRVSQEREPHWTSQTAHAPDVLFAIAAVDHRTCAHEQQGLEKRVRNQMKHPDRGPPTARPIIM